MSATTIGEVLFDRTSANHEEIWDDTELIRAYDRSHRQIQNRLRNSPKKKKDKSIKSVSNPIAKEKTAPLAMPMPMPPMMISPPKDEQDALHSMLMAWYMAGYHAGRLAALNGQTST